MQSFGAFAEDMRAAQLLNDSGALRHLRERRAKLDEVLFALHLHVTD